MIKHLRLLGAFAVVAAMSACDRIVDLTSTGDAPPFSPMLDAGGLDVPSAPTDGYAGALDTGALLDTSSPPLDGPFVLDASFTR
jgi:hypothetical protein